MDPEKGIQDNVRGASRMYQSRLALERVKDSLFHDLSLEKPLDFAFAAHFGASAASPRPCQDCLQGPALDTTTR
jgi:hypothetical protein